jgi:hypothetical protein
VDDSSVTRLARKLVDGSFAAKFHHDENDALMIATPTAE